MKKNDSRPSFVQQAAACALVIGGVALGGNSNAATAVGTASATVLESMSVTLSGTISTVESFTGSLSPSGPLLRIGSPPPTDAGVAGGAGGADVADVAGVAGGAGAGVAGVAGGAAAGAAPSAANSATVTVTRNANGSLSVSGGTGLTFAVSQPGTGVVNIEYN